jgi:hypothetical protein
MSKPSEAELKQALARAGEMREQGDDPDFIAKSLLSLNYRFDAWQKVVDAVKHYIHSGQSASEHAKLVRALREAEAVEHRNEDSDTPLGL